MSSASLSEEFGKALALHERALFFSTSFPEDEEFARKVIYFRLSIENCQDDSEPTLTQACDFIKVAYRLSSTILIARLEEVENIYSNLRRNAIHIADRHEDAISQSKEIVFARFNDLIDLVDTRLRGPASNKVADCSNHWKALHGICNLLMEEITYLSQRVDGINNMLSTKRSINYAIWGIGISAALSLVSTLVSLAFDQREKIGSDFYSNVGMMKAELDSLEETKN